MLDEEKPSSFRLNSAPRRTNISDVDDIVPALRSLRRRYRRSRKADASAAFVLQRMPNGYRIVSLEEDRFLEALRFIRERYFEDEPMCRVTDLSTDIKSMATYIEIIYKKMADMQSCYACREGDNKLVGVAVASINYKGDHVRSETRIRPYQGRALFDIMTLKSCVFSRACPYETLEIEKFFRVHAFCVDAEHEGKGIGTALINCCVDRARSLLVPACVVGLSSASAQSIAHKLGFTLLAKVPYNNFQIYNDEHESFENPFQDLVNGDDSIACMAFKIALPPPPQPPSSTRRSSKKKGKKARAKKRK